MVPGGGKCHQEGEIWHQEGKYGTRRGNMAPEGGKWYQEGETCTTKMLKMLFNILTIQLGPPKNYTTCLSVSTSSYLQLH